MPFKYFEIREMFSYHLVKITFTQCAIANINFENNIGNMP